MLRYHRPRSKGLVFLASTLAFAIVFTALLTRSPNAVAAQQQEKEIPLPVIMYHHILESGKLLGAYCITPTELRNDFERIKQDGYTLVPLSVYFKDSRVKVEIRLNS